MKVYLCDFSCILCRSSSAKGKSKKKSRRKKMSSNPHPHRQMQQPSKQMELCSGELWGWPASSLLSLSSLLPLLSSASLLYLSSPLPLLSSASLLSLSSPPPSPYYPPLPYYPSPPPFPYYPPLPYYPSPPPSPNYPPLPDYPSPPPSPYYPPFPDYPSPPPSPYYPPFPYYPSPPPSPYYPTLPYYPSPLLPPSPYCPPLPYYPTPPLPLPSTILLSPTSSLPLLSSSLPLSFLPPLLSPSHLCSFCLLLSLTLSLALAADSSSPSSLPILSPTPSSSSLLHIPEEQTEEMLPFPDVELPLSCHSSPSISLTPSPYTSLPSTPPQDHTPPTPPTSLHASPTGCLTMDPSLERIIDPAPVEYRPNVRERASSVDRLRTSRSSSSDLPTIGGVAGALSKGQKVVRGFLSSFSSQHHHHVHNPPLSGSHDYGPRHVTSQPLVYRNSDALLPPSFSFSSPSSAEDGEYAEDLSPVANDTMQFSYETLSTPPKTTPTNLDTTAFATASLATRYCNTLCVGSIATRYCNTTMCWVHSN